MLGCYTQLKNQADDALCAGCIFKRYNNIFVPLHMNVCSLSICFSDAFFVVVFVLLFFVVVVVVVCLFSSYVAINAVSVFLYFTCTVNRMQQQQNFNRGDTLSGMNHKTYYYSSLPS